MLSNVMGVQCDRKNPCGAKLMTCAGDTLIAPLDAADKSPC